jgi:hypothetical protein
MLPLPSRQSVLSALALSLGLGCGGEAPSSVIIDPNASTDADDPAPGVLPGSSEGGFADDEHTPACLSASLAAARVPDGEAEVAGTCGSSVAADTFRGALCSCDSTSVAGFLHTRSFRSGDGATAPEELGGDVGVNRNYVTGGFADVGGRFTVAGDLPVLFGGFLKTGEDLHFSPDFDVAGFVDVGRDARLGGALVAVGSIDIARDLYRAPNTSSFGLALLRVGGNRHTEDVAVAPPCACAPEQLMDVAGLVVEARADNDNASIGLDPHSLDLVAGVGTVLTLPTGRFYVHQIAGVGALRIHVTGKAALFVDDDLVAGGLFRVSLDPDAELDVFVKDNLVLAGAALLGDRERASATRFYVGGSGDITLAGLNAFAGNVYAPTANVLVGGVGRVFGSLFGKNILASGILDVGYDASIQDTDEGCPPVDGPVGPPGGGNPGDDETPEATPPPGSGDGDPGATPSGDPGDGDGSGEPPPAADPECPDGEVPALR